MHFLGDFPFGGTVHFLWNSFAQAGGSITRGTNGIIRVYKNNGTVETTIGVTDVEDFDGLTGVHLCSIDTTDAFYQANADFHVVLAGAVIDGQTVNAVLAQFSMENRSNDLDRASGIEAGLTMRGALRLMASVLVGKLSGAGTGTETFRNPVDTKARVVAAVDPSGNRTAITTDTT